jgi:hypothetical protein
MVHTDDAASTQELQNTDKYWASEGDAEFVSDVDKGQECGKDPLNQENHERMASKSLSESLLSPTFTSRAKSQNGHQVDVVKEPRKKKQLSEQAVSVAKHLNENIIRYVMLMLCMIALHFLFWVRKQSICGCMESF